MLLNIEKGFRCQRCRWPEKFTRLEKAACLMENETLVKYV